MNIIINNKIAHFKYSDFPMLISGKEKTGASLYTITLAANIYAAGNKILFFSAHPMAIEELLKQLGNNHKDIEYVSNNSMVHGSNIIIIKPGDQKLFAQVLEQLPKKEQRIIVVKNFENHSASVKKIIFRNNIVLSGDIDKSPDAGILCEKGFITKIFFSKPQECPIDKWIVPQKYQAIYIKKESRDITFCSD